MPVLVWTNHGVRALVLSVQWIGIEPCLERGQIMVMVTLHIHQLASSRDVLVLRPFRAAL